MDDPNINAAFLREELGTDTLDRSHENDVEHKIYAHFDKVVTFPVMTDGKDSGVCVYVGQTDIGRFAIGSVSDARIREIANRVSFAITTAYSPAPSSAPE